MRLQKLRELGLAERCALAQLDRGANLFTPLEVWHAKHRDVDDSWVPAQRVFDLGGIDVYAARDDHVFLAIDNVQKVVVIEATDITRTEEAVDKLFGRRLVEIGLNHDGRAHPDLAQ